MFCPVIVAINKTTHPTGVSIQHVKLDRWQGVTIDGWKRPPTMSRNHALEMAGAHRRVCMKRAAKKQCLWLYSVKEEGG